MNTSQTAPSVAEVCAQIKKFGYAASENIRIYGEEFEVLSDPFPNSMGIAIHVRSRRTSLTRVLQLPATVVHRALTRPRAGIRRRLRIRSTRCFAGCARSARPAVH